MAKLEINIPDDKVQEVINVLCKRFKYEPEIFNENFDFDNVESQSNLRMLPNPESKQQFVKRMVINFIRREYKNEKTKLYLSSINDELIDLS